MYNKYMSKSIQDNFFMECLGSTSTEHNISEGVYLTPLKWGLYFFIQMVKGLMPISKNINVQVQIFAKMLITLVESRITGLVSSSLSILNGVSTIQGFLTKVV